MIKKLLLLLSLLSLPLLAQQSDFRITGNLTASCSSATTSCLGTAGSTVENSSGANQQGWSNELKGYSLASVTVSGTYTGLTINFEFSDDGGMTWFSNICTRTDANIQEASEAVPNSTVRAWDCAVSGSSKFRVRASAWSSGSAFIGITFSQTPVEPAPSVALVAGTGIIGKVGIDQTTDVTTNGVEIAPTAAAAAGITPVTSTTTESNHVLKGSAGNLYGVCVTTGATAGFLMVFNATSAPADGAVTPQEWIQIGTNSTQCLSYGSGPPSVYSTGITAVFSSTGPFTKTASATAAFVGRVK